MAQGWRDVPALEVASVPNEHGLRLLPNHVAPVELIRGVLALSTPERLPHLPLEQAKQDDGRDCDADERPDNGLAFCEQSKDFEKNRA